MGSESVIRKRITFIGSVQGVGFRWRARQAANLYGCTGWCRNEWDGSVSMEIQGEEAQIKKVIRAVRCGRFIEIEQMDAENVPVIDDERSFTTE